MNETVVCPWATVCLVTGKFPAGVCDPGVPKLAERITNESGRAHETEPKSLKKSRKKGNIMNTVSQPTRDPPECEREKDKDKERERERERVREVPERECGVWKYGTRQQQIERSCVRE